MMDLDLVPVDTTAECATHDAPGARAKSFYSSSPGPVIHARMHRGVHVVFVNARRHQQM